ncbi:MAG: outer membrane protein transport protein [Labilithrix sp.]
MKLSTFVAALVAALATTLAFAPPARAGGIDELPDQGAQALGRGATFTAKADDATALYYNVAGLARQRGTKLQLSANFQFSSMTFQRDGSYAGDPADPATPWAGKPYPLVENKQPSFMLPMLLATTDLGLDRVTFGVGVFGPAAAGRTFQLGVNGAPSPARYDWSAGSSVVLFPTAAAAVRVTEHIDIGLGASLAVADFDQMQNAYADTGCQYAEDRRCDIEGHFKAKGGGAGGSVGVMARPTESIQIGAQLRSPFTIKAEGTTQVKLGTKEQAPSPAKLTLKLPLVFRSGIRYVSMVPLDQGTGKREAWDVELDATYEAWSSTSGPEVETEAAGRKVKIADDPHWKDTFSLRAGGAYNIPLGDGERPTLTLRAGGFFDSAATDDPYTRLGTNTMAKYAATAGIGISHGAFAANLAYAAVFSEPRTVTNGAVLLKNNIRGDSKDASGKDLPVINNGEYRAFTHVFSVSVEVNFEALFRRRKQVYGDPAYEDLARPDEKPAPPPIENEEAKRPAPPATAIATAATETQPAVTMESAPEEPAPAPPPSRPKPKKKASKSRKHAAAR